VEYTQRALWALWWWNWLEGYHPERLGTFAALYEIGDVDELLEYLRAIRTALRGRSNA